MILSPVINHFTDIHNIVDNWIKNTDKITCVCFFLIKNASISISHSVLLFKLDRYGIRSDELSWFTSYLEGRTEATCVHNNLSSFLPVKCAVSQGFIVRPLLLLYLSMIFQSMANLAVSMLMIQ